MMINTDHLLCYAPCWLLMVISIFQWSLVQGLYLSLNGAQIPNNSNISLDDIGRSVDRTIACHTESGIGNWYHSASGKNVQGFYNYRTPFNFIPTLIFIERTANTVSLLREGIPPLLGEYYCQESTENYTVRQTINIGYPRVSLSFRGITIPNNSFVDVDEIAGKRPDQEGILCHTDYMSHGHGLAVGEYAADWYFPNGSTLWHYSYFTENFGHVPKNVFLKSTGYGLLRMYVNGRPSERGSFYCKIPDATGTVQTLYINIVDSLMGKRQIGSYRVSCIDETFNPMITYAWFKDDTILSGKESSDHHFDIYQVGNYTCLVNTSSSGVLFQIRLNQVHCLEWTSSHANINYLTSLITEGIEEKCQCGFAESHITEGRFLCFSQTENHVTFRARLFENSQISLNQLVLYLEEWIAETDTVLIQGGYLGINKSCDSLIPHAQSPECLIKESSLSSSTLQPQAQNSCSFITGHIIWTVSVGIILTLSSIVVVLLSTITVHQTLKLRRLKISQSITSNTTVQVHENFNSNQ